MTKIFYWRACDAGSQATWCVEPGSYRAVWLNNDGEVQDHPRVRTDKNVGYTQFAWNKN